MENNKITQLEVIGRTRKSPTKANKKKEILDTNTKENTSTNKNRVITQEEDNDTIMSANTTEEKEKSTEDNKTKENGDTERHQENGKKQGIVMTQS